MATQQSALVQITNNTDGNAWILLFHTNSSNGTQSASWTAQPGQTVGTLAVYFETGFGTATILDYWSVLVHVLDGPNAGFYVNAGTSTDQYWKECQLKHEDAGQTLTFSVSAQEFTVTLDSGGCDPEPMLKLAPASPITHVFVLMLENHSFDNMFAMSGIPGITAATPQTSNSYQGNTYNVQTCAPVSMPTDPGHEFLDVVEQLGGENAIWQQGGPYPAINNSGFVANYATSTTETKEPPPSADYVDIMACFATPDQIPNLYTLATQFALCDHWYSSLPGPTWPNRFFVHGASSSGLDCSPTTEQMAGWEVTGFQYPNQSIYQHLDQFGIPYRFYNDSTIEPPFLSLYSDDPQAGSSIGAVPQVTSLRGVTITDINSLQHFASDLQGPYPRPYTFIEPHYGDVTSGSYAGGSSQHPMDDVAGGEALIAAVYGAIRNSPYWNTSLLIITYDEHGGLYDSVAPPVAVPPGDNPDYGYNMYGFGFNQYGVRVPAVIVSPLIPAGTVGHTLYDHSSVLKTIEELWGIPSLTARDQVANGVAPLLTLAQPRTDAPLALPMPKPMVKAAKPRMTNEERAKVDARPVPPKGNLAAALATLHKADVELSSGTPEERDAAKARYQQALQSRGHAREYVEAVMRKVGAAREQKKIARLKRG